MGISTAMGIGGDPIIGTPTKEAVELLMNDNETEGIIMIGEIGGNMEAEAARWIKQMAKNLLLVLLRDKLRQPADVWAMLVRSLAEQMILPLQK